MSAPRRELDHYLSHRERHGYAPFGVWSGDRLIGDFGLQRLEDGPQVELLYRLLLGPWGRGLATEAGQACLDYACDTLHLSEVLAVIGGAKNASGRRARPISDAFGSAAHKQRPV